MTASAGARELFWADAEARLLAPGARHVIRDSKTPSGTIPISSLRGPVISDALYRTLREHGLDVRFVYTIDDYDPMDSQTARSNEALAPYMGKPFCDIPSPGPGGTDFADFHASRFVALFAGLGITPEFHRLRDLYRGGALDTQIDLVLRNAATIREIYARISNVHKDARWLPVGVICERCGRLGTTEAYDFDGTTVAYECLPHYVEWAEGCGNVGRRSPFKGGAKLVWNLQWCAMWDHFGVTYEEGGKDLLTEGGSRDRSDQIYREVWKKEPPVGLQHEFLTLGGKKMGTSTGVGAAAHELATIYPAEIVRFLMLRTHPKRHIEFDPAGMGLPRLFDEYDRCADAFLNEPGSDFGRIWRLSQVETATPPLEYRARFSLVASWLQIPSIDPAREAEKQKATALSDPERLDLEKRVTLARVWLERWAPDEARYAVQPSLPPQTAALTKPQREFLRRAADAVGSTSDADAMQTALYALAKEVGLVDGERVSKDAFAAIYVAFLGKPNGPKAAWLLVTLPPAVVKQRLLEAAAA